MPYHQKVQFSDYRRISIASYLSEFNNIAIYIVIKYYTLDKYTDKYPSVKRPLATPL